MANTTPEHIRDAVDRLHRAITALILPTPTHNGQSGPSLFTQVVTGTGQGSPHGGGRPAKGRPMPPVWVAGLDWTRALGHDARTITRATPWGTKFDGWDTIPDRLDWLMQQKPRPQDADTVTEWASALERHADTAATLLDPVIMEVDAPCPECEHKTVTLPDNDGNPVEHRTLRFRTESADCRACGTVWRGMDIIELAHAANNPPPQQPQEL